MSKPTGSTGASGNADAAKTLGFVVFIAALAGEWPDELDDRLSRLTPDLRRRVFAFAARCAEIRAKSAAETAELAQREAKRVMRDLTPVARRLLSVPPADRTPEWRAAALEVVAAKRVLDDLPRRHAVDARHGRTLNRRLSATAGLDATHRPRRSCARPRAHRARRSSSSSPTSGADPGDGDDGESEPAGVAPDACRRTIAGDRP